MADASPQSGLKREATYNIETGSDDHYKKLGEALTGDAFPIVGISWDDARAYVAWLSKASGASYRLPSEAEWEYACRAGSVTPFWWGSSISPHQANYDGNYTYEGGGSRGEYRKRTVPAKHFDANPWGLYQVHGNVWEWCEDLWHDSYADKPGSLKASGAAWTTGDGGPRVLRGGSWGSIHRTSARPTATTTARSSVTTISASVLPGLKSLIFASLPLQDALACHSRRAEMSRRRRAAFLYGAR